MPDGLEGLRIYQMAEGLADAVWNEAVNWNSFARDTLGRRLVDAADLVGGTSPKVTADTISEIIANSSITHEVPCSRLGIGFGVLTDDTYSRTSASKSSWGTYKR